MLDGLVELAERGLRFSSVADVARVDGHLGDRAFRRDDRIDPGLQPPSVKLLFDVGALYGFRDVTKDGYPSLGNRIREQFVEIGADQIGVRATGGEPCPGNPIDGMDLPIP